MTMNSDFNVDAREPGKPAPGKQRRTSAEMEQDDAYFASLAATAQDNVPVVAPAPEPAPAPKIAIDTSAQVPAKRKLPEDDPRQGKRFWVTIQQVEGQPNFETVSVNGITCQVQRGKKVPLFEPFVEVLRNAVHTKYTQVDNGQQIEMIPSDGHAVPFSILGEVSEAEHAAWKAEVGA